MRTDRQVDMTNAGVALGNYVKAPNNRDYIEST
jgi:hypothetical protein